MTDRASAPGRASGAPPSWRDDEPMAKIVGDEAVFYSAAFDMDPPALGKGRSGYCRKLTVAEQQLIRAAELRVAAALSSPSVAAPESKL